MDERREGGRGEIVQQRVIVSLITKTEGIITRLGTNLLAIGTVLIKREEGKVDERGKSCRKKDPDR